MSKGCEMCNRTGVVFKPGMPGLDDKDTCPECGGRGIVESATVPAGKRDAAADLATCDATGDTEWAYEFYSEALPYWLREVERIRGVAEANLAMSADLIAMEGIIKELRFALENHAQFQRGIECQFCRLSFDLGTPDDVLTQHAMTCEKSPVVQEVARLRAELATLKEGTYCACCGFSDLYGEEQP